MSPRSRVVIVGAGIVGAACARALSLQGFGVIVVGAGDVGTGATAAGMGHLVAMDDSEAQLALTSRSLQLWNALAPELPADIEFSRCGTLWVAVDEEEMSEVHRKAQILAGHGIKTNVLDGRALAMEEPNLRPGLAGALQVPGDAVIYPPCAARWLLERAADAGAEMRIGVPVDRITEEGVALVDGTNIRCDVVVNAAGCAAGRLSPGLKLRPRKGHLVITDRYPGFARHQILELGYSKSAHSTDGTSVAFNVQPRPTGQLLIGSSRQFDDEDPAVSAPMLSRMIARALEYMPALAQLSAIRAWTGFRAATPDGLPLIGPRPGDPRVIIAAGHEGLGITTSLATAELVTDHLLGRSSAISAEPYLPSRFKPAVAHV